MTSVASTSALSSISTAVVTGTSTTTTGSAGAGQTAGGPAITWLTATKLHFMTTLNTLEACLTNLNSLVSEVDGKITSIYKPVVDNASQLSSMTNVSKLQACLGQLKESSAERMQHLIDTGFKKLSNGAVQKQVDALSLDSVKYTLTAEQMGEYDINDPWVQAYITSLDSFLELFRDGLSPGNNDRLISIITSKLALRLEQLIKRKKFTHFGAMQLEKELRCLFRYLTEASTTVLRDHTRLLQLCRLLNLDTVEDVSFYWNTSSWHFSASEVRKFLKLRVDFSDVAIRGLNL